MSILKPIVVAKTDQGNYRSSNEDSVFSKMSLSNNRTLLIVADGMGGIEIGKIASQMVVDTISKELTDLLEEPANTKFPTEYLVERLHLAFEEVNKTLEENQSGKRWGTSTVSCAFIQGDQAIIANIADCRVYHCRNKQLRLITNNRPFLMTDDPHVLDNLPRYSAPLGAGYAIQVNWPYIDEGKPDLSITASVQLNFWEETLQAEDQLLLCSDGLWMEIDTSEIENCLASAPTIEVAVNQLIDTVKAKGGRDNLTVIVCKMVEK